MTRGTSVEIRDAEVQQIEAACDPRLLDQLFAKVIRYKLRDGATMLMAHGIKGASRNLRMLWNRAVNVKESAARLAVKKFAQAV